MISHHAYLLSGTRRSCAAYVEAWCNERAISVSGNPDMLFLSGETATVESARNVVIEASRAPVSGEFRVIVWSLGYLGEEVSNTLLKTLEELPEKTRIFICIPPGVSILGTILSRVHVELLPYRDEDLIIARKFIGMTVPDRLSFLEKEFFKSDALDVRIQQMELVAGLAELLVQSSDVRSETREVVQMISYLNQGSATPKYILEYIAHLLPEKVKC